MKLEKVLFGAAVAFVDVLAVTALPAAVRDLHKKTTTHAHLYGTIGVYAVLALLTLWVIVSVVRARRPSAPAPGPRPGPYPYRSRV